MSIANSIRAQIVPITPEGYPFIGAFAFASLVLFWLWSPLGWLGTLATIWCAYFFRDLPRVSIFMSVFDCHVNRSPVAGRIEKIVCQPGKFFNADLDKASADNERNSLVIAAAGARVAVVQIAGLIARRIVCFAREGQPLGAGERFGMIRFGSRLDVYLPDGTPPLVAVGQTSIAGETVLADLRASGNTLAFRAG